MRLPVQRCETMRRQHVVDPALDVRCCVKQFEYWFID